MTILLALAVVLGGGDPLDLPSIGDLSWQEPPDEEPKQIIGVEAFVLSTEFDGGLEIENAGGLGLDLNFRWKPGKVRFGFSLGYAGWNTENDEDTRPSASVQVRQYRVGFGLEFPFRFVEFGIGSNVGIYRFRSDLDDDSSPYVELEGSVGFVPHPMIRFGLLGLATHTESSFNHQNTHLYHNYSLGLFAEVRF
jgi:hypothetical protein